VRELLHDVRDTWRGLRRDRLYATAVVGTLALTLGASTAVFSIVNGVLLRPLDHPDPGQLVSLREIVPVVAERYPTLPVTMRHFDVWRDRASSFSSMAAMDWRTATLTGLGDAAQLTILRASGADVRGSRRPSRPQHAARRPGGADRRAAGGRRLLRRELTIRVALGAKTTEVFSLVLRQSVVPLAVGVAAGLAAALAAGGIVASLLYEVAPRDPFVLAIVIGAVTTAGVVSAAAATLGGIQIDPAAALRDD
jgi:hypothetical protein